MQALAPGDMLPIIFFSIFFGAAVSVLREERATALIRFFDGVNEAAMVMVHWIMELAPLAVFVLIGAVHRPLRRRRDREPCPCIPLRSSSGWRCTSGSPTP